MSETLNKLVGVQILKWNILHYEVFVNITWVEDKIACFPADRYTGGLDIPVIDKKQQNAIQSKKDN